MTRLAYFLLGLLIGWWVYEELSEREQVPAQIEPSSSRRTPQPESKKVSAQAPAIIPDDLTRITGIGTVAAKALNDIGIWTYAQLAAQRQSDLVQQLPARVGTRVERDKWIEQAKKLAKG